MKVLVLGGTGAIGVHLVNMLSHNGVETVVTTRKHLESHENIKYMHGNVHDIEFLQVALQGHWDVIVDFMVYTTINFRERIDMLLNATNQYIFLSSARVYADSVQPLIETSSRLLNISHDKEFLSTDDYSLTKARQEDILRNTGRKNWTIIRPYITYSENRLQLGVLEKEEWLYRALQGRTIVFSNEISTKITTLTYGLDVSKGIMAIIGNSKALADTFHITTEYSYSWNNILTIYLEILEKNIGYKPNVLFQDVDIIYKENPAKYQILYDRLFNRYFDNSKIKKYINTTNFTKIEDGLKICLEEFLKKPEFLQIDWKKEALKDRQTKEFSSLKEIHGYKQKIKYLIFRYFLK
jgi:nucleoside-diphosphate-sugar epimerase